MPTQSEFDEYEEYSSEAEDVIAAAVNMIHSDPPGARPDLWREFYRNTVVYVPDGLGGSEYRAEAMAFAAMFPRPDEIPILSSQTRKRGRDDSPDITSHDEEMHTPKKVSRCAIEGTPRTAEPYHLNFGKHNGCTLDEIPPSYIDWMLNVGVYDHRLDLASELEQRGLLKPTRPDEDDIRTALYTWRLPAPEQAYEPGFYNPDTEQPWWIAQSDARLYFDVTANLLRRAGIEPLDEPPVRYPLYLVYHCAYHFKTMDADGVELALKRFLRKNERRRRPVVGRVVSSCERPRLPR
ncbi:hypothetical protein G7Y79_00052g087930 [Physcia stellaris]|nr:hypothetical protein G7Y79_00052g087930 [Physcia stellaris]